MILPKRLRPPQVDLLGHWLDKYNHTPSNGVIPSSVGDTSRLPQPGRGYNFDGVNDNISNSNFGVDVVNASRGFVCGGTATRLSTITILYSSRVSNNQGTAVILQVISSVLNIRILSNSIPLGSTSVEFPIASGLWEVGDTVDYILSYNPSTFNFQVHLDGVLIVDEVIDSTIIRDVSTQSIIFASQGGTIYAQKVYNLFGIIDRFDSTILTKYLAEDYTYSDYWYKCEDTGLIAFDSSGNGNHALKTNTDVLGANTFSYTGSDVPKSYQNEVGYSDGDGSDNNGLYIPRDESNHTLDVLGNPLQYKGQVSYPAKLVESNCLSFDGVNDFVNTNIKLQFIGGTTIFSIGAWVKYKNAWSSGNDYFISQARNGSEFSFGLGRASVTNGSISFLIRNANNTNFRYTTSFIPSVDEWFNVVVTVDDSRFSTGIKFYINGIYYSNLNADFEYLSIQEINEGFINIGRFSTSYIDVEIINTFITKEELTQQEVIEYSNGNIPNKILNSVNPKFFYPCAEGNGTTTFDASGNSNNGTLVNGVSWAKQDTYHYNYENGFSLYQHDTDTVANPDIRVPLGINPTITDYTKIEDVQPSLRNHNGAETKIDFNPYNAPALSDLGVNEVKPTIIDNFFISKKLNNGQSLFYSNTPNINRVLNYLNFGKFELEYQKVLLKAISLGYGLPSLATQQKDSDFIKGLKDDGEWNNISEFLYMFNTDASPEFSTLNWVNPDLFQATLIGNPSFSINNGWTGTSGNAINTNWSFNTAQQASSVDFSYGTFLNGGPSTSGGIDIGMRNSAVNRLVYLFGRNTSGRALALNCVSASGNSVEGIVDSSDGFKSTQRSSSVDVSIYNNGQLIGSESRGVTAFPSENMYILGLNSGGSLIAQTGRTSQFAFTGKALDHLKLNNRLQTRVTL